jgi:tight adherence protein C
MLLALAVFCLVGALAVVAEMVTVSGRQREASLRRAKAYGVTGVGVDSAPLRRRTTAGLENTLARMAQRLHPKSTVDAVRLRLIGAGLAGRMSPTGFLASKVVAASVGVALGGLLGTVGSSAVRALFLAVVFGVFGFVLPDGIVAHMTKARREQIRTTLPDALDVLAVSVEAGLGFDAALAKLSDHMQGPLVEEFALTLGEMRIGETRQEALRKMAERADVAELTAVIHALVQADQLGSPLAKILRVQASEARRRRQAAAEERAMKAPVKMIVPTAIFIFPAMFIVILGPAFLHLSKIF